MHLHILRLVVLFIITIGAIGCNKQSINHWIEGVPGSTPLIILTQDPYDIDGILTRDFTEISAQSSNSNNSDLIRILTETKAQNVRIEGLAVYPANADEWKPVWILQTIPGLARRASEVFSRPFTTQQYKFSGLSIYVMYLGDSTQYYALESGNYIYLSQSSYAVEEFGRTIVGEYASISVEKSEFGAGDLIVNTPKLDKYIATETAVKYRPGLSESFRGSGVAIMKLTRDGPSNDDFAIRFSGIFEVDLSTQSSPIVQSLTGTNHINVLDRYVSQDVALAVFMNGKSNVVPKPDESFTMDLFLNSEPNEMEGFDDALGDNFALAAFSSSGFLSVGEYAYVRMISNPESLKQLLKNWVDAELITRDNQNFIIQSKILSHLVTGGIEEFDIFHLTIDGNAVLITQRPALIRKLISDRERRRTLFYTEEYLDIRKTYPEQLSGFVYTNSEGLSRFVQSLLNIKNSAELIFDNFDLLSMGFERSNNSVNWITKTYSVEQVVRPYDDRWLIELDGTELTGYPTLANIGGSSRDEILAATKGGTVIAVAADGTQVFRVSTGTDVPIGSPLVYDWYSNNQMSILQGAGNKIYGWSNNGISLPGFPIELAEQISSPILVSDITRNGLAEIVVATNDRRIHVLNQRGININGWPQSVNSNITIQPFITPWLGRPSIIAYAENVIFAWEPNGVIKSGFPLFNRSPLRGDMMIHNDYLMVGSADGTILSIGRGTQLALDQAPILNPEDGSENLIMQGNRISDGGIFIRPVVSTHQIRYNEEIVFQEPVIFTMTDAGSLFAINLEGRLRFTQSLGQPTMQDHPPIIVDIDRNGQAEIVGLAGFGRMYAWTLASGERFYNLPTTSVIYPVFKDINGNGKLEVIAGTEEGLRSWTIN